MTSGDAVPPAATYAELLHLVDGQVGRRLQVGLVEARRGEHPAHAVEVEGLTGVARRGQGQQLAVEVEARLQHADGLQRLVRGAGEDRRVRLAALEEPGAVGGEGDQAAAVAALDEAGAHDLGEEG